MMSVLHVMRMVMPILCLLGVSGGLLPKGHTLFVERVSIPTLTPLGQGQLKLAAPLWPWLPPGTSFDDTEVLLDVSPLVVGHAQGILKVTRLDPFPSPS